MGSSCARRRYEGYEIAKDEYVRFEPEELKALEHASSSALVIDSFVPAGAIDPVYFEDTYYLGVGKNGDRGYRVLVEALQKTQRVAINRRTRAGDGSLVRGGALYCGGYEARRRRADRFAGATCSWSDLEGVAFASAFRPRLALSVATRSVVGGRPSASTRSISSPAIFCSIAFRTRFRYSSS
jgi:Ku70/Ku80 beta-barrel domain